MAVEYFGAQSGTNDDNCTHYLFMWYWGTSFTCPGSGSVLINELSADVKLISGSGNIRIGIYDTSGDLVAQGTAEVAVTGSSYSWQGHMTAAACGNVSLTGGQSYKLALANDEPAYGPSVGIRYLADQPSGYIRYKQLTDYTGGLPATIGLTDNTWGGCWNIRCGVETGGSAAVTGTATASITEGDVVAGSKTIIITLTGDTWITA
jgi:hypothetical protein